MDNAPGAILKFDKNGKNVKFNVIANSDKEAEMVKQRLIPITESSACLRVKQILPRK